MLGVRGAHLAAIAIEHGAILGSFDADFERFAGLQFEQLAADVVHEWRRCDTVPWHRWSNATIAPHHLT